MEWISTDWRAVTFAGLSVLGMFVAIIVLTRFFGLRSFSKMSAFDFANTVAIGSVFATVVLSKEPPLVLGFTVLFFLFATQIAIAAIRVHVQKAGDVFDNSPRLIMIGDKILDDQMRKAKITRKDLLGKLREANVLDFSQIEAVVAETTGDVSVLHRDPDSPRLNPEILEGVIGSDQLLRNLSDQ